MKTLEFSSKLLSVNDNLLSFLDAGMVMAIASMYDKQEKYSEGILAIKMFVYNKLKDYKGNKERYNYFTLNSSIREENNSSFEESKNANDFKRLDELFLQK